MSKKIKALAIDTEFTHFDMYGGDLLALGVVEIYDDLTLGRELELYFKPQCVKYFSEKAQEVHGISYFKAMTFPEPQDSLKQFLHWLVPLKDQFPLDFVVWGAWDFDRKWLETTFTKYEMVSSYQKAFSQAKVFNGMKMARKLLKHVDGGVGLDNIAKHYNVPLQHHQVLSDAKATAQIYINLEKGIDTWTGELF